jgi:hypothetical protein
VRSWPGYANRSCQPWDATFWTYSSPVDSRQQKCRSTAFMPRKTNVMGISCLKPCGLHVESNVWRTPTGLDRHWIFRSCETRLSLAIDVSPFRPTNKIQRVDKIPAVFVNDGCIFGFEERRYHLRNTFTYMVGKWGGGFNIYVGTFIAICTVVLNRGNG